jgi:hypothetical protein
MTDEANASAADPTFIYFPSPHGWRSMNDCQLPPKGTDRPYTGSAAHAPACRDASGLLALGS